MAPATVSGYRSGGRRYASKPLTARRVIRKTCPRADPLTDHRSPTVRGLTCFCHVPTLLLFLHSKSKSQTCLLTLTPVDLLRFRPREPERMTVYPHELAYERVDAAFHVVLELKLKGMYRHAQCSGQ